MHFNTAGWFRVLHWRCVDAQVPAWRCNISSLALGGSTVTAGISGKLIQRQGLFKSPLLRISYVFGAASAPVRLRRFIIGVAGNSARVAVSRPARLRVQVSRMLSAIVCRGARVGVTSSAFAWLRRFFTSITGSPSDTAARPARLKGHVLRMLSVIIGCVRGRILDGVTCNGRDAIAGAIGSSSSAARGLVGRVRCQWRHVVGGVACSTRPNRGFTSRSGSVPNAITPLA